MGLVLRISKNYVQLSIKDVSHDGDSSGFTSFCDGKTMQKIHMWQKSQPESSVLVEHSGILQLFEGIKNSGWKITDFDIQMILLPRFTKENRFEIVTVWKLGTTKGSGGLWFL